MNGLPEPPEPLRPFLDAIANAADEFYQRLDMDFERRLADQPWSSLNQAQQDAVADLFRLREPGRRPYATVEAVVAKHLGGSA